MDYDDIFDEDTDELEINANDWKKMIASRKMEGFANGRSEGQEESMQEGFDDGFKQGFLTNLLISKIKGIFNGLLELGEFYEGSPITEEILLESQLILDKISDLETNNVIDDLIEMKLGSSTVEQPSCEKSNDCFTQNDLQSLNLNDEQTNSSDKKVAEDFFEAMVTEQSTHKTISNDQLQELLLSSPELKNVLKDSEQVLQKLGWEDNLYTILV